jgi:hypothetical protein
MDIQNKPAIQVDPHEELVRELRLEMQVRVLIHD